MRLVFGIVGRTVIVIQWPKSTNLNPNPRIYIYVSYIASAFWLLLFFRQKVCVADL